MGECFAHFLMENIMIEIEQQLADIETRLLLMQNSIGRNKKINAEITAIKAVLKKTENNIIRNYVRKRNVQNSRNHIRRERLSNGQIIRYIVNDNTF